MPWTDKHLDWLQEASDLELSTNKGVAVKVFDFIHREDDEILTAWVKHFRNHYCCDKQIDRLRRGTPYTRAEYLNAIKFPDSSKTPGPSIRAGDFGEILIADYLQYILDFWVPRSRYINKDIRNESTKGCDIIGFKYIKENESPSDTLAIFEAKAQFSDSSPSPRLQDAIDDSAKDQLRKAESLNALKQRFIDLEQYDEADAIERFQDPQDRPYKEVCGAAALFTEAAYDEHLVKTSQVNAHPKKESLMLIVIKGEEMMKLVHKLYRLAANEA